MGLELLGREQRERLEREQRERLEREQRERLDRQRREREVREEQALLLAEAARERNAIRVRQERPNGQRWELGDEKEDPRQAQQPRPRVEEPPRPRPRG